jgi:hypothetical protein
MFDFPQDQTDKEQWWCGRPIDGRAVGQPGQQVQCRGQEFHVFPRGNDVWTQCVGCRAQEDARIRRTTNVGVVQGNGVLGCPHCNGNRFAIYDAGNEVQVKCAQCGGWMDVGVGKSLQK